MNHLDRRKNVFSITVDNNQNIDTDRLIHQKRKNIRKIQLDTPPGYSVVVDGQTNGVATDVPLVVVDGQTNGVATEVPLVVVKKQWRVTVFNYIGLHWKGRGKGLIEISKLSAERFQIGNAI